MNIIVCMKQVPGSNAVKIDPKTNSLIKEGGERIINPFDMYALEEGMRLKEKHGGKVTAISMGPSQAKESLKEAIALGIDEVLLLSDPAFDDSDTLATSYILNKAITKLGAFDIIICGKQTMDGDTGQVGPQLAEQLGIPFAACVSAIEEIREGYVRVRSMVDEGHQITEMPLPALITVVKEINVPRLPSLRGLMKSKKSEVPAWNNQDLSADMNKIGASGSPTRIKNYFLPKRSSGGEMLQGELEDQVGQLVEKLRDLKVI